MPQSFYRWQRETNHLYISGTTLCRAWSFGRNRTGLAHHAIPFAGLMVLLPFIPTLAGLASGVMAGSIHPQLSPPGRNDLCAKSRCVWHHGSNGSTFRFILYSQRFSGKNHRSHCGCRRYPHRNICSAQCQRRRVSLDGSPCVFCKIDRVHHGVVVTIVTEGVLMID